jgi:GntR family transcriptional regulator, transcriptional repressor for pyruvate dehydrogenase complex
MCPDFEPLKTLSLKESCIQKLEELILSGQLKAGERLPSERDLAVRLNISRPVLHEALVDLAAKGLVKIVPRRGVVVNDYRKEGSCAILSSLLLYHQGQFAPELTQSLFAMRCLLEMETARLAATAASGEQIARLEAVLEKEKQVGLDDSQLLTELDFEFHLLVSIASGNLVYPLIINSFKNIYTHFTRQFFQCCNQAAVIGQVFDYHRQLVEVIKQRQPERAAEIMSDTLSHGEKRLREATGNIAEL